MDAAAHHDPCTSRGGQKKERWPNWIAAWYVVELCALGKHGRLNSPKKLYAYTCEGCDGFHLATCRTPDDFAAHDRGMAALRVEMTKNPLGARKKTT